MLVKQFMFLRFSFYFVCIYLFLAEHPWRIQTILAPAIKSNSRIYSYFSLASSQLSNGLVFVKPNASLERIKKASYLIAVDTLVRTFARVHAHVFVETGGLGEAFPTNRALQQIHIHKVSLECIKLKIKLKRT